MFKKLIKFISAYYTLSLFYAFIVWYGRGLVGKDWWIYWSSLIIAVVYYYHQVTSRVPLQNGWEPSWF